MITVPIEASIDLGLGLLWSATASVASASVLRLTRLR